MRTACSWLLFPGLLAQAPPADAAGAFHYVVPAASATSSEVPLHALSLTDAPPSDVDVQVPRHRGALRFGQLRYGALAGTRVVFAVDQVPGAEPLLYVDADRDRKLTGDERVPGGRAGFTCELRPRLDGKGRDGDARQVRLVIGGITGQVGVATLGFLEGRVDYAGRRLLARRYDGDGNGLLSDPADSLWLDFDGDGQQDPVRELLPYRALQQLDGKSWVVRGDDQGTTLALAELQERGAIRIELPGLGKPAALHATLASDDGVVIGIDAAGADVVVPTGNYRITNLQLALPHDQKGSPWTFVFAESSASTRWQVGPDKVVAIEPCRAPRFAVAAEQPAAGGSVSVRPGLTLGNGMYLVTCFRGENTRSGWGAGATVSLVDGNGRVLDTSHSGFA
ncbi:MAG TPA: hypothetical protein VFT55_01390 [Planctomycetota bacterium]|nr:hypothetical protein [Planctomycetota bacterium]